LLMKQAELFAPGEICIREVPLPSPLPDELLIRVAQVGICGSDLHAYHGRHPFIELPVVPGHEFAGTVAGVGSNARDFKVGQRITVEPSVVCGECYNCTRGRYNICDKLQVIGCQTVGAMAEYLTVPASKALVLPDEIDWDRAVMVEPLAVAVHAIRVAEISPGSRVLVLGAGTIGLLVLQAAKALGASSVVITDLRNNRLALASELGADRAVDPTSTVLEDALESAFGLDRADVILECVGVATTIRDAIRVARKGTRIVPAGVFEEEVPINLGLVQDRELEVAGTLMYADDDFATALNLLCAGDVTVTSMISHHFPLSEAAEAFAVADSREDALKVVLQVDESS
jgi:L-iditol 2-dehydrogenase